MRLLPLLRSSLRPRTITRLAVSVGLLQPVWAQVQVDWVAPRRGVTIGVDADDNVYTADYTYALGAEIDVVKHDAQGNLLWQASIDQTDPTKWERASWLGVDGNGDVIVCGTLMSGYSNPVEAASVLLKFAGDGTPLWRVVYESDFDGSSSRRCLIGAQNEIYVLGAGSGPSGYTTKVKKFTSDGVPDWTYFDAAGIGLPVHFKFAPDGALVISARAPFGSVNGYAKIGLDGQEIWSLPGVQSLTVGDAAGDSLGNTYVVHGEYVVNGGTVVKKLDAFGTILWEEVQPIAGFRVEVGGDDRPIVCGFPNSGTAGAAFFKLAPDGTLAWSNLDADGPLGLLLHAQMLIDDRGDAYLAAGTLFEMAVCKVRSNGASAWTATMPGSNAAGLALGHAGRSVFVVGGRTARLVEPAPPPHRRAASSSARPGGERTTD